MLLPIQVTQVLRNGRWEVTFDIGDLTQGEAPDLRYDSRVGHILKRKEDAND